MKKKSPREALKSLSWTYVVLAVLVLILGVVIARVPNITDILKEHTDIENPLLYIETQLAVNIIIYLWYFWLARRYADGKSNGTFYMILLILGVVGGVTSFFAGQTKSISSMDFIIAVVGLIYVYKIRSESK